MSAAASSVQAPWVYGILLQQGSAFVCTLGLVLQKVSASKLHNAATPLPKQPLWLFGFACFLLGQLLMPAALALAPQALLSCLAPSALVANSVLTPCLLGEQLRYYHFFSVLLIFAGCIVSVQYGLRPPDDTSGVGGTGREEAATLDLNKFRYYLSRPPAHALFAGTLLVVVVVGRPLLNEWRAARSEAKKACREGKKAGRSEGKKAADRKKGPASGSPPHFGSPREGGGSGGGNNSSGAPEQPFGASSSPFALILLSSIFGAVSVSSTKVVSTMLATEYFQWQKGAAPPADASGDSPLSPFSPLLLPFCWLFFSDAGRCVLFLLLFGIGCMAFLSISLLNASMLRFSSLTTVTLSTALGLLCQFLYGTVFFEEYKAFSRTTLCGTAVGILLNMAGLGCLLLGGGGKGATAEHAEQAGMKKTDAGPISPSEAYAYQKILGNDEFLMPENEPPSPSAQRATARGRGEGAVELGSMSGEA
eukprot:g16346.t1